MIHRMSSAFAAALILVVVLCSATQLVAADRFGVVGIENATDITIRLQHRWGNGAWNTDVLPPRTRKTYWWTYPQQNADKSPPFHVKFDSDLSPGHFVEKYDLGKYRAPDHEWSNAHKHIFRYDGNKKFIELYDEKK